jgi:hypothetical protein
MLNAMKGMLLSATLLLSGTAVAHEGHDHGANNTKPVKGTVTSMEQNTLTLKGTDGKPVNVHVDDKTQYENAGAEGKMADLKAGARVVVQGEKMKDGTLHATKVRFGKAGAKAPAGPAKVDPGAPAAKPAAKATPAKATPKAASEPAHTGDHAKDSKMPGH